jgi:hypothetical protein
MLREKMGDEASCILVSLQLSDYVSARVDDVLAWLDLVVGAGWDEEDCQGEA